MTRIKKNGLTESELVAAGVKSKIHAKKIIISATEKFGGEALVNPNCLPCLIIPAPSSISGAPAPMQQIADPAPIIVQAPIQDPAATSITGVLLVVWIVST